MLATESMLLQMRGVAIAGAGLSTAIILLLVQLGQEELSLQIALYSAVVAIPAWISAWQYVQPYIILGSRFYGHFSQRFAGWLGLFGIAALFIALASVIWHLSPCASLVFAVACIFVVPFVALHVRSVSKAIAR